MKLDIQKVTFAYVFIFLFALSQEANVKAQKSLFSMLKATYKQNETEEKEQKNNSTKISRWMSISSDLFMNRNRYPPFKPFQVEVGADGKRKNVNYFSQSKKEDLLMIREMGANAIRTAHYPHEQYVYDLADEMGFIVWNEIPFYLIMADTEEFRETTKQQLIEMIIVF